MAPNIETYCPLRIVLPLQKVGAVLYGAEHGIRSLLEVKNDKNGLYREV
jgi:hypothetical protein